MYLIDKVDKEAVKEMSPEEVNFHFDQMVFKMTTEKKRKELLKYLDIEEASETANTIKIHGSIGSGNIN